MRARHRSTGGVAQRARGGAVEGVKLGHLNAPHDAVKHTGEGARAKMHAAKRARGGSCWYCGGAVKHHKRGGAVGRAEGGGVKDFYDTTLPAAAVRVGADKYKKPLPMLEEIQGDDGTSTTRLVPSRKKGGGIHIKKSHEGLLHKNLHVAGDKKIPASKLAKAKHSPDPAVRKRAVFAENAKRWHHG